MFHTNLPINVAVNVSLPSYSGRCLQPVRWSGYPTKQSGRISQSQTVVRGSVLRSRVSKGPADFQNRTAVPARSLRNRRSAPAIVQLLFFRSPPVYDEP